MFLLFIFMCSFVFDDYIAKIIAIL